MLSTPIDQDSVNQTLSSPVSHQDMANLISRIFTLTNLGMARSGKRQRRASVGTSSLWPPFQCRGTRTNIFLGAHPDLIALNRDTLAAQSKVRSYANKQSKMEASYWTFVGWQRVI